MYKLVKEVFRSLPSRERGLKYRHREELSRNSKSLPSRERGLKFENYLPQGELGNVAPFTGAWIEIDQ